MVSIYGESVLIDPPSNARTYSRARRINRGLLRARRTPTV